MKSILKKFNILLSEKSKKRIIKLVIITLFGAFLEVIGVSLMVPMFGAIMNPEIIHTNAFAIKVCEIMGLESHKTFVIACIIVLIIIFIFKDLYLVFQYCVQARFVYDSRFETQKMVLHAFLCKPYEYYLNASSGEILRIANGDVVETYKLLMTVVTFITETFVSLALVATIFVIDPVMTTALSALIIIIVVAFAKIVRPWLENKGNSYRYNVEIANNWILQAIQGIKELKIGRREEFFENNFKEAGIKQISAEKWSMVLGNTPRLFIELGCVCSTLTVIAFMIYFGKPLEALVPALGAFAVAAVKLMPSALHILNMTNTLFFQGPSIDNLLNTIEDLAENTTLYSDSKHSLSLNDKIEFKNITYKYPNSEKYILNNATFRVKSGTSVGIVGASGAGKTTAIDVLLGLLKPESGEILTDGKNVMDDYADWLSHIGYIPQTIFMLDDTIAANVSFGPEPNEKEVKRALKEAQLLDFVEELPEGIYTKIGERGIRLSGGQRQRIGIARALYNNPEILVFDEATSSLDNETESAIIESINALHGFKTIIIIAHRLQTIEKCDEVYRVKDGKISKERKENDRN